MGRTVGIDLGTTNCCVAYLDDGVPTVMPDVGDGHGKARNTIPSFVAVGDTGPSYVGRPAKYDALKKPESVLYATKRLMGQSFGTPVVQTMKQLVPYEIIPNSHRNAVMKVGQAVVSPEDAAAALLTYIRDMASGQLGQPVTDAVITVPANFNSRQREATKEAGERAGLNVLRLINEPTAAALVYGFGQAVERTIVVYDLGGGTFDVSVLHIDEGVYEVLATGGDTFLGGEDFDNRIVTHLIRKDILERAKEPMNPVAMLRLRQAAEVAKMRLSTESEAELRLRSFLGLDEYHVKLTRDELEEITNDIIQQTIQVTAQTLRDAKLPPAKVDEVLVVGGQTRMPAIRRAVGHFFDKQPNYNYHPDEVVAMGAALHAIGLSDGDWNTDGLLLDVTPLTLGIASAGDLFTPVLEKNSKVPCAVSRVFSTHMDNQEQVRIAVLQGESRRASQNVLLGEFVLDGIEPAPRLTPKIRVTFRLDANGILFVEAQDEVTGESKLVRIKGFKEDGEAAGPDQVRDWEPSLPSNKA